MRNRVDDDAGLADSDSSVPYRYIVMRQWSTPKRTYRVGVGIFETRAQAQTRLRQAERSLVYLYSNSEFYIVPIRILV